jgi:uncharacterized membrane protein YoaK (UPF0700 family)
VVQNCVVRERDPDAIPPSNVPFSDEMSIRDAAILGGTLGFVAGFSDASTFVGADGIFCAHVTGNFVVLAADIALHARADEWLKLATFPIFVAAVLGATWLCRRLHVGLGPGTVRGLLLAKAVLIAAAALAGLATASRAPGASRTAFVALLVTAMGVQNALHRLSPTPLPAMTTVMTGNVTQWLTETMTAAPGQDGTKHRLLGIVIVAFAIGCAAGALGVAWLGFGVLGIPAGVALIARSRIR